MFDKKPMKEWKSYAEQLDILRSRGLVINDEQRALGYLRTLGYYRLSGYLYSFRKTDGQVRCDEFVERSCFDDVKQLYMFDKKLRQLALDALERVEVALRVSIAHRLGRYDALAHTDKSRFNDKFNHESWLAYYRKLLEREWDKSVFIQHHFENYPDLPVWAGCEVWDFGSLSKLFQGMLEKDKDHIAKQYGLQSGSHLETHLRGFNFICNVSAHHGRLWNRKIVGRASLKGLQGNEWKQLSANEMFVYFCLMKRMLDAICPNSMWGERFLQLCSEFPQVENGAVDLTQFGMRVKPHEWDLWR